MGKRLRRKTGLIVHRRYPGREVFEIPREHYDLAIGRTEYLHPMAADQPLAYLLGCAWMQGVKDADKVLRESENTSADLKSGNVT